MNARTWQSLVLGALLALRASGDEKNVIPAVVPPTPAPVAPAGDPPASPAPADPDHGVPDAGVAPAPTDAEPVKVLRTPNLSLPPLLDQVVRMSEHGSDEGVVKAYIESAPAYRISGNDIIQLQDLGISQNVILSLIERSKGVAGSQSVPTSDATGNAAANTGDVTASPANTTAETGVATPPLTPAGDAYEGLSSYGSWLDVPGYGRCWQPTVVVINPAWRPYCDAGDWLWSDCGWYWHSYYSWGWAPFHYGRWFSHPHRGWMWCPDRVWGPAWVTWRHSGGHFGWAPLPPGAHFAAGVGWTHHGARVGAQFDFGLGAHAFTFVPHDRFTDHHVGRHAIAAANATGVFRTSTVQNNFSVGPNNRFVNQGIPRATVAATTRTPIREASVGGLPRGPMRPISPVINRTAMASPRSFSPTIGRPNVMQPSGNGAMRSFATPQGVSPVPQQRFAPVTRFGGGGNGSVMRTAPVVQAPRFSAPTAVPRYSAPAPVARYSAPAQMPRYSAPAPVARYSAPSASPRFSAPAAAPRSFGGTPSFSGRSFSGGSSHAFSGGGGSHSTFATRR